MHQTLTTFVGSAPHSYFSSVLSEEHGSLLQNSIGCIKRESIYNPQGA